MSETSNSVYDTVLAHYGDDYIEMHSGTEIYDEAVAE